MNLRATGTDRQLQATPVRVNRHGLNKVLVVRLGMVGLRSGWHFNLKFWPTGRVGVGARTVPN